MSRMPLLLSIQTGTPKSYGVPYALDPFERTWRSAIVKTPVLGEIWLGEQSLAGDFVSNLEDHGGADNAVLCYAAGHYAKWREEFADDDVPFGGFGENFTVNELDEHRVCLGDIYALGEVRIEVSGPRRPCYKLERRWRRPGLIDRVVATNRCGWYCRTLNPGLVRAPQPVELIKRPHPSWTIAQVNQVSFDREQRDARLELCAVPQLATRWRRWLLGKLQGQAILIADL